MLVFERLVIFDYANSIVYVYLEYSFEEEFLLVELVMFTHMGLSGRNCNVLNCNKELQNDGTKSC